jgi:hypothetical protein
MYFWAFCGVGLIVVLVLLLFDVPQVPFLSREREAALGQAVVLEALQALYNICKFNRRVHLEVAATGGIVPHLCR